MAELVDTPPYRVYALLCGAHVQKSEQERQSKNTENQYFCKFSGVPQIA